MSPAKYFQQLPGSNLPLSGALALAGTLTLAYAIALVIYRLYFHPLACYPGPRLAAATDLWWAYASITGRYPWIIEEKIKQYGDVVRIAPNELVFARPQAAADVYLSHVKNMETFHKPGYNPVDGADQGITFEPNPAKHRQMAKKLAPAFSAKNLRAKEPTIQKHLDRFIEKLTAEQQQGRAIDLYIWTEWLALDLAADMTYGQDWGHVRDGRSSVFLDTILKVNLLSAMIRISTKFRTLTPLMYLFVPPTTWFSMPRLMKTNRQHVMTRINRQGQTAHLDFFQQLLPAEKATAQDEKAVSHMQMVAGQLLLAGWQPVSNQAYNLICRLAHEPRIYNALRNEVRSAFTHTSDITTDATAQLPYLSACVQETLRAHPDTVDGLPRVSPGALVDGHLIPRGVICQFAHFSAARDARSFAKPLCFCPERWLPPDHALWDPKFQHDDLKASLPFSQGPRGCVGASVALAVMRVLLAKVIWHFDLEAAEGQDVSFDRDYRFLTWWERPPFWVRFHIAPS